ncbi:MAG: hypothetical protein WB992_16705 [Bryobacteraceae bacterium]
MNSKLVEEIANAVLYEGYMLYPYRASAVKNRQRWNFGVLYPRDFAEAQKGSDAWSMRTECLAQVTGTNADFNVRVRFLQLIERTGEGQAWQEGMERDVKISALRWGQTVQRVFWFPPGIETDGNVSRKCEEINGTVKIETEDLGNNLFKICVSVFNTGSLDEADRGSRDRALLRSLASAHTILEINDGEFISLLDPPEDLRDLAAQCKNVGTWPVLAGEAGERDAMLSSPIILYDYPQIAPESAGALFDGTEIDEILTLRIMTLTDEEKREMGQTDERARQILQRTEEMPPEQLMKMHGVLRNTR